MSGPCRLCGGKGVIRCADVYRSHRGVSRPIWELSTVVACGCRYKEAA
ncbi:hypothetical protein [Mycobacterium sp. 1245499.0]|nr:hypothetical protein [Mycobacterium sp. 1245499.0]